MWKLKCARESTSHPYLRSLNEFEGRQVWEFDAHGGTSAEREAVKRAQDAYTAKKLIQKHSSDLLLRLQCTGSIEDAANSRSGRWKIWSVYLRSILRSMKELWQSSHAHAGDVNGPSVTTALREGISFYSQLQQADGHWPGDYGGPMFLMPGLVITCYVTGCLDTVLTPPHQTEMLRYLRNHQNADGGYGLHIEGHSTMFGTALRCANLTLQSCLHRNVHCSLTQDTH